MKMGNQQIKVTQVEQTKKGMNMKIINKLKINQNALKLTSVFLAFAIATFGSIAALAWGPERQTYTI